MKKPTILAEINLRKYSYLMTVICLVLILFLGVTVSNYNNLIEKYKGLADEHESLTARYEGLRNEGYDIYVNYNPKQQQELSDKYMAQLLDDMVLNNKKAYYIKNEIAYWHPEYDENTLNYMALWIYSQAVKYEVDPYLMVSLGIAESKLTHSKSGERIVKSHKGAIGIYQLTEIIYSHYDVNPLIFEENVIGGTRFVADLSKQYDDLQGVLGHYNGGINPYYKIKYYSETKNYVYAVIDTYSQFLKKY